jgi:hypothetical protein
LQHQSDEIIWAGIEAPDDLALYGACSDGRHVRPGAGRVAECAFDHPIGAFLSELMRHGVRALPTFRTC